MGNCQAVDAAALVIQHPNGKIQRMYWSITASEVMKMNPGHYVSLIIPLPPAEPPTDVSDAADNNISSVLIQPESSSGVDHHQQESKYKKKPKIRFTRVKLLRPTDTLVLGRAYRLVTTQEVMKVLRAKKHAKMNKNLGIQGQDTVVNSSTRLECGSNSSSKRTSGISHGVQEGKPRLISQNSSQVDDLETQRLRTAEANNNRPAWRSTKSWRPSLQSISEAG